MVYRRKGLDERSPRAPRDCPSGREQSIGRDTKLEAFVGSTWTRGNHGTGVTREGVLPVLDAMGFRAVMGRLP